MIRFEQHDGRWYLGLRTQWLNGLIAPATSTDLDSETDRQAVLSRIRHWQGTGYVIEDACVLSVFEHSIRLAGANDFLNIKLFPRLIDLQPNGNSTGNSTRTVSESFAPLRNTAPGIYPIVDNLDHLRLLLNAGAEIIQLRIKSASLTPEIDRSIGQATRMASDFPGSQLFINDYWQAAITHGAYGIHLGQEDLLTADLAAIQAAGLRLGVSSHAFWEVARAVSVTPSTIACGPVFPTRVKAMPWIPQGTENLRYWTALLQQPVIGIGGVNAENLKSIHDTGCAAASVIQAIVADPDPAATYQRLQQAWRSFPAAAHREPSLAKPTLKPDL